MIDFDKLSFNIGDIFTPGTPINSLDLFSGRIKQIEKIKDAISQRGYNAVLYGERGVGKTSLSNILRIYLDIKKIDSYFLQTSCDASDNYSSLWKKVFQNFDIPSTKLGIGFNSDKEKIIYSLADTFPETINPNFIKNILAKISENKLSIIVFDEFDRIEDKITKTLIADTIKLLSDSGIRSTILLIGVANSVDELIDNHNSIERSLVQVLMPRMSFEEIEEIINKGLKKAKMTIKKEASDQIVNFSQGLPYITHLLALHSSKFAISEKRLEIFEKDIDKGIEIAVQKSQQSVKSKYYKAVISHQSGNIYKEVLLSCALANVDEMGYFTARSVIKPLSIITGKEYHITTFTKHLNNFAKEERGGVIIKSGEKRKVKYKFINPIMKQFIIMKGFVDSLIDKEKMKLIRN